MARVVQRKGNPPYALFSLLVLSLVLLVAAVLFGSYWSQARKDLDKSARDFAQFATPGDRNSAEYSAALNDSKAAGQTIARHLLAQVSQLQENLRTKTQEADKLTGDMADLDANCKALAAANAKLTDDLKAATDMLAQQRLAFGAEQERVRQESSAERGAYKTRGESYDRDIAEAAKTLSTRLEEKDRQLVDMQSTLLKRDQELLKARAERDEALRRLGDATRPPDRAATPDGKVLTADVQRGVAYINLGQQDRVRIGSTFAVFDSHGEIKADTVPKARLVVKNVMANVSEVEIVEPMRGNPVLAGDIIANVAFSKRGAPAFVIVGTFDLDGDGTPDEHGSEAIATMIREYGGQTVERVSPDVDYIVTGQAPLLPPNPAPNAPASQRQLWEDLSRKLTEYNKMVEDARGFQIPMLNTNRLLVLLGRGGSSAG